MNRPSPDDMKAMGVIEYVEELEEENKKLKKEVKKRKMVADENGTGYDMMKDEYEKLEKENKELKEKLALTENDRDEREVKAKDLLKENKELKAYKSGYILLKERIDGLIETQERLTLEKNELEKENKLLKAELFEIKRNTSYNWLRDELGITSNFEKRGDITLMRMKEAELIEKYIEHLEQENKELKEKLSSFSL